MALFFDINPLLNAIADKVTKGASITIFIKTEREDIIVDGIFLRVTPKPRLTYLGDPLLATLKVLDSPAIEVIIDPENLDQLSIEDRKDTPPLIDELREAFIAKLPFYYLVIAMDETDFIIEIDYRLNKHLPIKNFISLRLP